MAALSGPLFFSRIDLAFEALGRSSGIWYQVVTTGTEMDNKPKGRWKLTEPLASDLLDFCEAHRGSPEHRIIADALRAFIDERLAAEPELRKRFDEARRKRLGVIEGGNVTVLPTAK